jgi:hypothetical protein
MKWRRGYREDLSFTYLDSSANKGQSFEINFKLSDKQLDFFSSTFTEELIYLKRYTSFELKPFYFNTNNRTLFIIVKKSNDNKNELSIGLDKVFQNENYTYYSIAAY